jgi:hypothetical protein
MTDYSNPLHPFDPSLNDLRREKHADLELAQKWIKDHAILLAGMTHAETLAMYGAYVIAHKGKQG